MNYKYILFDWDGTLAKTLDIWLEVYKYLCKKHKADVSNLSDLQIVEKSFGTWAKGLSDLGIKNSDNAYKEALELVDKRVVRVELYPNVEEILKLLVIDGKKLALHTSSFKNLLYPALKLHNLEKYFSIILTKDDVKNGKPDPEIILKELDFFNASPGEAVVVGDMNHDIKAGKNAGISTILFYPSENQKFYRKELLLKERPDFVISNLLDLKKVVN